MQPELVGRDQIPAAALLDEINANVRRAVGPALGGLLISAAGPEGGIRRVTPRRRQSRHPP